MATLQSTAVCSFDSDAELRLSWNGMASQVSLESGMLILRGLGEASSLEDAVILDGARVTQASGDGTSMTIESTFGPRLTLAFGCSEEGLAWLHALEEFTTTCLGSCENEGTYEEQPPGQAEETQERMYANSLDTGSASPQLSRGSSARVMMNSMYGRLKQNLDLPKGPEPSLVRIRPPVSASKAAAGEATETSGRSAEDQLDPHKVPRCEDQLANLARRAQERAEQLNICRDPNGRDQLSNLARRVEELEHILMNCTSELSQAKASAAEARQTAATQFARAEELQGELQSAQANARQAQGKEQDIAGLDLVFQSSNRGLHSTSSSSTAVPPVQPNFANAAGNASLTSSSASSGEAVQRPSRPRPTSALIRAPAPAVVPRTPEPSPSSSSRCEPRVVKEASPTKPETSPLGVSHTLQAAKAYPSSGPSDRRPSADGRSATEAGTGRSSGGTPPMVLLSSSTPPHLCSGSATETALGKQPPSSEMWRPSMAVPPRLKIAQPNVIPGMRQHQSLPSTPFANRGLLDGSAQAFIQKTERADTSRRAGAAGARAAFKAPASPVACTREIPFQTRRSWSPTTCQPATPVLGVRDVQRAGGCIAHVGPSSPAPRSREVLPSSPLFVYPREQRSNLVQANRSLSPPERKLLKQEPSQGRLVVRLSTSPPRLSQDSGSLQPGQARSQLRPATVVLGSSTASPLITSVSSPFARGPPLPLR